MPDAVDTFLEMFRGGMQSAEAARRHQEELTFRRAEQQRLADVLELQRNQQAFGQEMAREEATRAAAAEARAAEAFGLKKEADIRGERTKALKDIAEGVFAPAETVTIPAPTTLEGMPIGVAKTYPAPGGEEIAPGLFVRAVPQEERLEKEVTTKLRAQQRQFNQKENQLIDFIQENPAIGEDPETLAQLKTQVMFGVPIQKNTLEQLASATEVSLDNALENNDRPRAAKMLARLKRIEALWKAKASAAFPWGLAHTISTEEQAKRILGDARQKAIAEAGGPDKWAKLDPVAQRASLRKHALNLGIESGAGGGAIGKTEDIIGPVGTPEKPLDKLIREALGQK